MKNEFLERIIEEKAGGVCIASDFVTLSILKCIGLLL